MISRLCDHLSEIKVTLNLVQPTRNSIETSSLLFLLGFAPDGGCTAVNITTHAGGLLHHLFTLVGRISPA